jgi:hypothetical protein
VTTVISSPENFGKRSLLISCIKEQLEETKAAGKHVKIHWIPAHRGITGNEKADELAKLSNRHGRDSQNPVPAEDLKSLWKKNPKRNPSCGTRRWDGSGDGNTLRFSLITAPTPGLPNAN